MKHAIIACAALLVPEQQRAEWLAEWRAEIWYAEHLSISACFGAFQDAWWLRRHGPLPRAYGILHLEAPAPPQQNFPDRSIPFLASPGRCLGFLAVLAALAIIAIAVALPRSYDPAAFLGLLPGVLIGWVFVPITSTFSLGDYPKGSSRRRWLFLAAKMLLMVPIADCLAAIHPATSSFGMILSMFAMRWILEDQRKRCPTCLRLLSKPVRIGQASRMLLEWHGNELVCLRGHGLLHVPELPSIWPSEQRWMDLDPSWSTLFPEEQTHFGIHRG